MRSARGPIFTPQIVFLQMPIAQVQTEVMQNGTPRCDQCQGLVKPDVVFFGEDIPMKFVRQAIVDLPRCDLLLCMGSSFQVPTAGGWGGGGRGSRPRSFRSVIV